MPISRNPDTEVAVTIATAVGAAAIAGLARLCKELKAGGIVDHDVVAAVEKAVIADLRGSLLPQSALPFVLGPIQKAFADQ